MYKLIVKLSAFVILALASTGVQGQDKNLDCSPLKMGTFYSYPKNSADQYICRRDAAYQYEKNLLNGDTIVFKIEWLKDCKYTLRLISTNAKLTADEKELWQDHSLVYEITAVTQDYYVYKGYIDKSSNLPVSADTMWIREKLNTVSRELIQPVKNELVLKKAHFSDTSKYAVLYLYRTGKFAASAVDMIIYFDDNLICDSKNGSAFIFKILKEGNFELSSVSDMNKKSASLSLSIKFGQKYYVNQSAKFAVNMASVYVPALKLVDADKGAEEFQNAY